MHKLLIFDLDGTLAGIGQGILPEDLLKLKALKEAGYEICVSSGKSRFYLCGFFRQAGLNDVWMIAEHGAIFQKGIDLPPKTYFNSPVRENVLRVIGIIRREIDDLCGDDVWYQPNEVNMTAYPRSEESLEKIRDLMKRTPRWLSRVTVYENEDHVDFIPKEINLKNALTYFTKITGYQASDMIAIGDSANGLDMISYCDKSVVIGKNLDIPSEYKFDTIGQALDMLLKDRI